MGDAHLRAAFGEPPLSGAVAAAARGPARPRGRRAAAALLEPAPRQGGRRGLPARCRGGRARDRDQPSAGRAAARRRRGGTRPRRRGCGPGGRARDAALARRHPRHGPGRRARGGRGHGAARRDRGRTQRGPGARGRAHQGDAGAALRGAARVGRNGARPPAGGRGPHPRPCGRAGGAARHDGGRRAARAGDRAARLQDGRRGGARPPRQPHHGDAAGARIDRARRPPPRLPDAGVQPRGEHALLEVTGHRDHARRRGHEGADRADARAGAER